MIQIKAYSLPRLYKYIKYLLLLCVELFLFSPLYSQQQVSSNYYRSSVIQPDSNTQYGHQTNLKKQGDIINQVLSFPDRFFKKVESKINGFDKQLTQRTDKALSRLIKQEERLKQELEKGNKLAADNLFTKGIDSLRSMRGAINSKVNKLANPSSLKGAYFPFMDTLKTSLAFLQQGDVIPNTTIKTPSQITDALARVKAAEAKLQYSEKIKSYLAQRQQELRQRLAQYSGYDRAKKELDKMGKEIYYYQAQIKGYKEMLSEPSRIEEEAIKLLRKMPAFKRFMSDNGALAALFNNYKPGDVSGLQTREMVSKLMKDQMGLLGPEGNKIIEENLKEAKEVMDKLKNQAAGGSDATIPGFKPNGQKTKSLWQRIEIGTDCQFNKNNTLLPSTGDFGLSISYHITKNGIIGIGGSWKMGMGDIHHIRFTHEGIGMRSFVEYAIWKGFNLRGGWERNFLLKQVTTDNLIMMKKPENWQESALIGISKKMAIPLKMPILKKKAASGNMQILYDFLHNNKTPTSPAFQLRVGMGL
jgi:hypothetical protein